MENYIKYNPMTDNYEDSPWYEEKEKRRNTPWYGQKEVPNVRLICESGWPECPEDYQKYVIYFDCLKGYYEEFNSETRWKVVLQSALFNPKDYSKLTKHYQRYTIETEEIWRNEKTGKDEGYYSPIKRFKHLCIKHRSSAEGDPESFYIILWNDKYEKPVIEKTSLEDVKL